MAELMREQDGEQSEGEGQARSKSGGMLVKKCEGVDKFVERDGLILRVGYGELSAGDEAGAKSEQEENAGKIKRLERRARGNDRIGRRAAGNSAPVQVDGNGWRRILLGRSAHEVAGVLDKIDANQYSTVVRVRASFECKNGLFA